MSVEVITAIGEHIVTPILLSVVATIIIYLAYKSLK
jgi:hypothetical protein